MSKLGFVAIEDSVQQSNLRRDPKRVIHLDLVSQIPEPLILQEKVIGLEELKALATVIDHCLPVRGKISTTDLLLFQIMDQLLVGNLGIFSREMQLNAKIFRKYPKVEKAITDLFGALEDIGNKLALAPDYDVRILKNEPEYLLALGTELQSRNLDYCSKHHPHLVEPGKQGFAVVAQLASALKGGELKTSIILRLREGDKLRNKGAVTEYIDQIFGSGFRLERAWQRLFNATT